ncbi:hypothetical protein TWF730_010159 [Orbilia blumenaviensis]|uniref:Uncharacterized protein n=1 Tax=Orbilia blumenaviensis TaxID=1796055 RepID=A0AAV9UTR9_9PEZI
MSPTTFSTAFLTRLRTYPSLPSQTWYYITLVAISICNKPELIAPVLSHAFTHSAIPGSTDAAYVKEERAWLARNPGKLGRVDEEGRESALRILRRCREGLVKSGAIGGIPKAINALYHLRKCHEPHLLDSLPDYPSSSSSSPSSQSSLHPLSSPYPTTRPNSLPPNTLNAHKDPSPSPESSNPPSPVFSTNPTLPFLARGSDFFNTLYGPSISKKVLANLQKSSPDLQILATWIYALILSEGTVLTPRETSFVLISALIPQDVNAQLKPHLLGAINNGAGREEVDGVRECVIDICKELGVAWKGEVAKL